MEISFTGRIREIIADSGLSRYAICKRTGIDQSTMSRFMSGQGGLSMASLDRLAEVLGMDVVVKSEPTE